MQSMAVFPKDVVLSCTNVGSTFGLSFGVYGPLLWGASSVVIEDPWNFHSF